MQCLLLIPVFFCCVLDCNCKQCCAALQQIAESELSLMIQRAMYNEFVDKLKMKKDVERDLAIALLANKKVIVNSNKYISVTLYYRDMNDDISSTVFKKDGVTIRYITLASSHWRVNTAIVHCVNNDGKQTMTELISSNGMIFGMPVIELEKMKKKLIDIK